jgi:hypothetical protein
MVKKISGRFPQWRNELIQFSLFLFLMVIISRNNALADDDVSISGYVRDAKTGEVLIGASIKNNKLKTGGRTNNYGFYSLSLPNGNHTLTYSYIGYKTMDLKIDLNDKLRKDIELEPTSIRTQEVVVTGARGDENVRSTQVGFAQISPSEIRTIPVIFGEQDLLKTIQLLPGINSTSEGSSGFFVRGGGPDQNLILLDEATVYNPSHLMGFFSVFNSDAIKDVKIIKGSAPAQYGGRLSSLLDIKMNEGNLKEYKVNGGIGLISSRLTLEGPIVENKGSFIISGRRTYADLFLMFASTENLKKSGLYFYDLNLKANYKLGENDRIFLSGYLGRDVAQINDQFGFDWGNQTLTLRWNHLFSDKLFLNSSLIYSKYDYVVDLENGQTLIDIKSAIKDYNWKEDFQYFISSNNTINFGLNAINHSFVPGKLTATDTTSVITNQVTDKYAMETALYISHEFDLLSNVKVNYGLRYSGFALIGPGTIYSFDKEGLITKSSTYSDGEMIKYYGGFEPRFSLSYLLENENSIKIAYSRNMQYLHLLSNTTSTTPLDIWQPSTNNVMPGIADQVSLGYYQNFMDNGYEAYIEGYYKYMQNQIDYKNGADLLVNNHVESELVFGSGIAYGVEFFLKKHIGDFTGWISYSWSKSERKFDAIDNGNPFPAKYDRRNDISLVGSYQLNEKWNFSATWVYNTGNAVTFPSGKYMVDGNIINLYSERNGYNMPDYHRLDLGVTYYFEKHGSYKSNLNFSMYNAYGQKNAYSIAFKKSESDPTKTEAVMTYLFTFFPSVTYNFNF